MTAQPYTKLSTQEPSSITFDNVQGDLFYSMGKGYKTSAFTNRNLKGCPPKVYSHCYIALVCAALENDSVM